MEIIGYISAILIGISIGLMGGGGSILTVPVMVYLFGMEASVAAAYSLFVVGTASTVGAVRFYLNKLIDLKIAIIFALPSLIAVYCVRRYLVPALPDPLFTIGDTSVSEHTGVLVLFACLMLFAAIKMILPRKHHDPDQLKDPNLTLIAVEGLVVGALTGLVGAGGGFMIVPALVLLVGLPMKRAVATSVLIIAAKSLIGFIGDMQSQEINWEFLFAITSIAIAGIFIGMWLGTIVRGSQLKRIFGWFVLTMAILMLLRETVFA